MQPNQSGQGFYSPTNAPAYIEPQQQQPQFDQPGGGIVDWQASEYVHHAKGAGWFASLGIVSVGLLGTAIWFKQWTFAVLVVIMAVAFGYFGVRKPRTLHYRVSDIGVKIDNKQYPYTDFRAFGIVPDGAFYSITLIPTKRLAPGVNVYFAESDGEKIVDILGSHLPMEKMQPDVLDSIMRKLRF